MANQPVLEVKNLCKRYPSFYLNHVSFTLEAGTITGFVGRNGAGKSTTLGCLLDLVHPTEGEIRFFGQPEREDPRSVRQRVGFATGTTDFYMSKKLSSLTAVTRRFYRNWDEDRYYELMKRFALDPDKTPAELSSGMKVKYSIATALSYHAPLLLLDEPTSGLDPYSRSDLLEIFLDLVENDHVTILFSTQITSDLEDYADNVIYIRNGRILADMPLDKFTAGYRIATFASKPQPDPAFIGLRRVRSGYDALVKTDEAPDGASIRPATLSDIMIHLDSDTGEGADKARSK